MGSFDWFSSKKRCIPLVSSISENCQKKHQQEEESQSSQEEEFEEELTEITPEISQKKNTDWKTPILVAKVIPRFIMKEDSKGITREEVGWLQKIFQDGLIHDPNPEDVRRKTKKMVVELNPVRNKTFGKFVKKKHIKYMEQAIKIWEKYQFKTSCGLGSSMGVERDKVGVYFATESFPGTGVIAGDVFIFRQEPINP